MIADARLAVRICPSSETGDRQVKQFPLWFWGFLCIFGGAMSKLVGDLVMKPPKTKAEAMGRATGQLIFIAIGVILIVVHFIRRTRR